MSNIFRNFVRTALGLQYQLQIAHYKWEDRFWQLQLSKKTRVAEKKRRNFLDKKRQRKNNTHFDL